MKAAVIPERGAAPAVGEFRDPEPQDGAVLIDMDTAGLGGWDVLGAYRLGVEFPCVIRGDLLFRTLSTVGTGQRPAADRRAIWERLLRIGREEKISVDYVDFSFDQAAEAWAAQVAGPHAKVTARIRD